MSEHGRTEDLRLGGKGRWAEDHALVQAAVGGDLEAIEDLLVQVRRPMYNLALRFLWHPDDAEDAAQEILMRVLTRLSTFEGRARFSTWVYRIAANYLIDCRKSRTERREVSFDRVAASLRVGSREPSFVTSLEAEALAEQVKAACTHAMLQCLNREQRLAFLVGEVLQLNGEEAELVLGISGSVYRKRLSRARAAMQEFLHGHCGVMNGEAPCRCTRRIEYSRRAFEPYVRYAEKNSLKQSATIPELAASGLQGIERLGAIYRTNPEVQAPAALLERIRRTLHPKLRPRRPPSR